MTFYRLPLTFIAAIAGACAADRRNMAPNSALAKYELASKVFEGLGNLNEKVTSYYDNSTSPDGARRIRNDIVSAFLIAIDSEYELFTDQVLRNRAAYSTFFDVSAIGAGTAAALTPHGATSQLLAGVAAALTGTRAVVDQNFFYEQTMPIIQSKMDSLRVRHRQTVISGFTKPVSDYPLGLAASDLHEYYLAGTFGRAFAELSRDTPGAGPLSHPHPFSIDVSRIDNVRAQIRIRDVTAPNRRILIAYQRDDATEPSSQAVVLNDAGEGEVMIDVTDATKSVTVTAPNRSSTINLRDRTESMARPTPTNIPATRNSANPPDDQHGR